MPATAIRPTARLSLKRPPGSSALNFHVFAYGALGLGYADNIPGIDECCQAASAAAVAAGGTADVHFDGSQTYYITKSVRHLPNINLKGHGCSLLTDASIFYIVNPNPVFSIGETGWADDGLVVEATATIVANPAAGDNKIYVDDASVFSVGNPVAIRAGQNPIDPPETIYSMLATITGVVTNPVHYITINRRWPYSIDISTSSSGNKKVTRYNWFLKDAEVDDFNFECMGDTDVEGGVFHDWAENVTYRRLTANKNGGRNMGAGLVCAFHSEGLRGYEPVTHKNENTTGQASKGRHLSFANCRDVDVYSPKANEIWGPFIYSESYSEGVRLHNPVVKISAWNGEFLRSIFFCGGHSELDVFNLTADVRSVGYGYLFDENGATGSKMRFHNVDIKGSWPYAFMQAGKSTVSGVVRYDDGVNKFAFDMDRIETHTVHLPFFLAESRTIPLAWGMLLDWEVFTPSYLDGLSTLTIGTAGNGVTKNIIADAVPGSRVKSQPICQFGWNTTPYYAAENINQRPFLNLATTGSPRGFVTLKYRIARYVEGTNPAAESYVDTDADFLSNSQTPKMSWVVFNPAAGGETSHTIPGGYPLNPPNGYEAKGSLIVFKNGLFMIPFLYVATDHSTIVYITPLTAGDQISVIVIS